MSKRENFYRRNPNKALAGMVGLSLEERGVYNTILDLLYSTWRPLEDNRPFIANWCGCAVQKLNPILRRLIAEGKISRIENDGLCFLEAGEDWTRADEREPLSDAVRAFVFERDGYRCTYCDSTEGPWEVDHVLAVIRGGDDSFENLVCACRACNRSKGAKLLAEWVR